MNHDAHHVVKELPVLTPGESVWVTNREESGEVIVETATWSYPVETPGGQFRKNQYLKQSILRDTEPEIHRE